MSAMKNKLNIDEEFYKDFKFSHHQILWFNYTDIDVSGVVVQPYINFLIRYFKFTHYTEVGIGVGTNFVTTCQYIEHKKIKCKAHGISLYDVPLENLEHLNHDDLIRATNLKKDNRYPFATISDHSTRVKLTEQWGQLAAGLVVLNHLKDFQASSIGQYYEILPEKSILLVLGAKWPKYAKSLKLKFLEINGGIIIFKDFNDKVIDGFIDEFRSIYQERLDLMGQYFLDKAKSAQVCSRNSDVFNLDLVKPYKKKHYFAIIGLFKNESGALKEWIEHYLKFGADHFYLVDNNSSDKYMQILSPYIDRGLISLYACSEDKYQLGILRELTNTLKNETIWVGVFDLDEFVYPQHSRSILDVIKKFDAYEAIVIPWLIFGSNAHIKQPESIVKGFTRRMKYDGQYSHTKAIVRTSSINILTQHVPWTKNNKHIRADGKKILNRPTKLKLFEWDIPGMKLLNNHYALQSLNFFEKVKVDRTEVAENCTTKKTLASFTQLDKMANEIVDNKLAVKE